MNTDLSVNNLCNRLFMIIYDKSSTGHNSLYGQHIILSLINSIVKTNKTMI